jgi:hypothetical protein
MRLLRELYSAIVSSVYNPPFYAKVREGDISKPIQLTALLGLIGSAIVMLVLYAFIVPFAFSDALQRIESVFPDDLIVTVAHGEMSINKPQPYHITNTLLPGTVKDLVIFDGDNALQGDAHSNSTLLLVKRTYIMSDSENGSDGRVASFDKTLATTTVTKTDVTKIIGIVRPYWKPVILVGGLFGLILAAIFIALFWLLFHLIYLLFPAVLIYLYGALMGKGLLWRHSYIVALYASIPVAIVMFLLARLTIGEPPFLYTLFVMLVAIANLSHSPTRVVQQPT